ncbi:glycosyltransferase family 25 protein [Rhizobium sp. TRM95111]|uniref:glycosyltransferase family 25 protein n=1 Tax=Rhizobium alarense TaxID=2846851 RepID=UPI001F43B910|nr:glycosyltransferase family 25 protein [Rhizobium alarense]MCF3639147.1 glycosyltransferase family 25 protein [Rhizobium alarense]
MWPVYFINLDHASERRNRSTALFRDAGLEFRRIAACDWRSLSATDLSSSVARATPRFAKGRITPPEVACFLSHMRAWETIAAGTAPAAFVFEDDFALQPDAARLMADLSGQPPTWDMLKLFTNKPRTMGDAVLLDAVHCLGTPDILPPTTLAYAITRPAAAALARRSMPFSRPIDLYLKHWWEHGAAIKLVQPSIVVPRDEHLASSAIERARRNATDANPVARFLRNAAYQLSFRVSSSLYASSRATEARWVDDSPRIVDVCPPAVTQEPRP